MSLVDRTVFAPREVSLIVLLIPACLRFSPFTVVQQCTTFPTVTLSFTTNSTIRANEMQNSFIIIRAIFFSKYTISVNVIQPDNIDAALILYFNLLATIFAGWNIMSSTSSGMPGVLLSMAVMISTDMFVAPGASAFLVVNAALIFALTILYVSCC